MKKYEQSLTVGIIKHTNTCLIGVPMGEEKEKAERILKEIMAENIPNYDED